MRFFSKVYSVVEILHQRNRGLNAKILRGGASHQDLRGVHTIFFTTSASALTAPGHTQCRSKGNVYQQWCEHASLPHALLYAEPVRTSPTIRRRPSGCALLFTNNCEHLPWYNEPGENRPQESPVD